MSLLALLALAATASSAEQVVETQVAAYNRGDLDGFLATYAPGAALLDHPGKPWMTGTAEMRKNYGPQFAAKPPVTVQIAKRIVSGDYVVDEEIVMRGGKEMGRAVATYHVADGKIDRVDFLPFVPAPGSKTK